jgi:hypothetical protein
MKKQMKQNDTKRKETKGNETKKNKTKTKNKVKLIEDLNYKQKNK